MKRGKLKKTSKQSISVVQRKLWELCKVIIRKKYGNTCYTCNKTGLEGSNWHTGHFLPKASCGAFLKYDLRNLRPQCYNCNINLGGNGAEFYRKMVNELGNDFVAKLFLEKKVSVKAMDHYQKLIIEYSQLI